MEAEQIAATLAEHENRIKVSEHRISDLENQQKEIQQLTISVHDLAKSVQDMVMEQKTHSERLSKLEGEPAEQWKTMKRTMLTSIVSVIAGAVACGLIIMAAQYL